MAAAKKFVDHCAMLGHGLAITCAVSGLGLIVAAALHLVVYGIALFGVAVAIDVAVAVHCHGSHHYRRRHSNARSRALHTRKR